MSEPMEPIEPNGRVYALRAEMSRFNVVKLVGDPLALMAFDAECQLHEDVPIEPGDLLYIQVVGIQRGVFPGYREPHEGMRQQLAEQGL